MAGGRIVYCVVHARETSSDACEVVSAQEKIVGLEEGVRWVLLGDVVAIWPLNGIKVLSEKVEGF